MTDPHIIQEGDNVLIIESETKYIFTIVKQGAKAKLGKKAVKLDPLVGSRYGEWFEVSDGELVLFDPRNDSYSKLILASNTDKNNMELNDHSTAQKLSQDDIDNLKKSGVQGEELVKKLIENSVSFAQKTTFSQDKYVKKKKKKHHIVLQVLKPTSNLICKAYFTKSPEKINHIRPDTLANIIMYSNVKPNIRTIVYDRCSGLITTSFIEKMSAQGTLYNIHNGNVSSIPILRLYNKQEKDLESIIKSIPIGCLLSENDSEDPWQVSKKLLKKELEENPCDSLVICGAQDPASYFKILFNYLKPSGVFVVYSQYLQQLAEIDSSLHLNKEACHIKISETWYRQHQVLENRTHPEMQMSATGGFILTGIKLCKEVESQDETNENKRTKTEENEAI